MGILVVDCVVARKMKKNGVSFGWLDCGEHFQGAIRPKHGRHCQIHLLL